MGKINFTEEEKRRFDEIVRRCGNIIFTHAVKLGLQHADAKEVMQEVLMKLYLSGLWRNKSVDELRGLIYQITTRTIIDRFRRKTSESKWVSYGTDNAPEAGEVDVLVAAAISPSDFEGHVNKCQELLTDEERRAVDLYLAPSVGKKPSYQSIAAQLRCSESTAHNYVQRAIKKIKDYGDKYLSVIASGNIDQFADSFGSGLF